MRLFKRTSPPGTAPGTLPEVVSQAPGRVRLTRFAPGLLEQRELPDPEELGEAADEEVREVRWLDLAGLDIPLIQRLGQRLQLHPLVLEDVINTGQRPKTDDFGNSLFVVLDLFTLAPEGDEVLREQVSVILQPNLVLSVREHDGVVFDPVRERLRTDGTKIRALPADYLAYALLDAVVDNLFPVLERLGEQIEEAEEGILEAPDPEDLNALHLLRRELLLLRKSTWPLRDVLNRLLRSDSTLIHDETRLYLRDVADHVVLCLDIIETYREMVSSLTELYLSAISNRMNEVMKVLTIIATIFMPLSFIAGVYGMNFNPQISRFNMPELGWVYGYPWALLLMTVTAGLLLLLFHRKRWI